MYLRIQFKSIAYNHGNGVRGDGGMFMDEFDLGFVIRVNSGSRNQLNITVDKLAVDDVMKFVAKLIDFGYKVEVQKYETDIMVSFSIYSTEAEISWMVE